MDIFKDQKVRPIAERNAYFAFMVIAGVALNVVGSYIVNLFGIPLYLDTIGTILAAYFGGYIPGIVVALLGSGLNALADSMNLSYGVLNVLLAVATAYFKEKLWFKSKLKTLLSVVVYGFIGGGLGAGLTWLLYGFEAGTATPKIVAFFYNTGYFGRFFSQFLADFLVDIVDKAINVAALLLADRLLKPDLKKKMVYDPWAQTPLSDSAVRELRKGHSRGISLRAKFVLLLTMASVLTAVSAVVISILLFRNSTFQQQSEYAENLASIVATAIDGDKVGDYLENGESAPGYEETRKMLEKLRESSPYIEYIYIYKFEEDGCHVVFDLDSLNVPADATGSVVPVDPAFKEYEEDFIQGKEIAPIVSNDEYGWLLTAYVPVRDSKRNVVAYAAVDLSVEHIQSYGKDFLVSQLALFLGIFIFIYAVGLSFAEYKIILPLNSIAYTASEYREESKESMEKTTRTLGKLNIETGDEIENLYNAIFEMATTNLEYIDDIGKKNETISEMQMSLINVLADMVESRDQNTGNHIMKTAEYAKIIMEEMRREGIYEDQLTDDFISDVYRSTPLHDIGKISISDTILNKPGKLTPKEFEIMKNHAVIGAGIIEKVIDAVPGANKAYLKEARNLALYHHEKWNGEGYPMGLSGEDIPLSARIMAVADVFDALVSERSYKKAFSFEDSVEIIRQNSGSHFDPKVAGAFLNSLDEVRKISQV